MIRLCSKAAGGRFSPLADVADVSGTVRGQLLECFPTAWRSKGSNTIGCPHWVTWPGSCDRGEPDQWVWQLTVAVAVISTGLAQEGPGHWSEARGREEATVSHIKRLQPPTLKGIHSLKSRRYIMVDRLRSLTQMDAHPHVHASVHAHCALRSSLPNECPVHIYSQPVCRVIPV